MEETGLEEELQLLGEIYIHELELVKNDKDRVTSIVIQLHPATGDDVDQRYVCMTLRLDIPEQYPELLPEINIKNPRGVGEEEIQSLLEDMHVLCEDRKGSPVLYELIELAKDSLTAGNIPHCPCMICLEHFQDGDKFTKTPCYHYFHETCLARYVTHVTLRTPEVVAAHTMQSELKQNKLVCPVCREEIDNNIDELAYNTPEETITFVPTLEMRAMQKKMAATFEKQRINGGIIDVEAEKNKYLVTHEDVVLLAPPPKSAEKTKEDRPSSRGSESLKESKPSGTERTTKPSERERTYDTDRENKGGNLRTERNDRYKHDRNWDIYYDSNERKKKNYNTRNDKRIDNSRENVMDEHRSKRERENKRKAQSETRKRSPRGKDVDVDDRESKMDISDGTGSANQDREKADVISTDRKKENDKFVKSEEGSSDKKENRKGFGRPSTNKAEHIDDGDYSNDKGNTKEREYDGIRVNNDRKGEVNNDRKGEGNNDRRGEGTNDRRCEGNNDRKGEGNNDRRGEGNNDRRGEGNNDRRGEGNNDRRGGGNNDRRSEGNNDGRGEGNNDRRGEGNNNNRRSEGNNDRRGEGNDRSEGNNDRIGDGNNDRKGEGNNNRRGEGNNDRRGERKGFGRPSSGRGGRADHTERNNYGNDRKNIPDRSDSKNNDFDEQRKVENDRRGDRKGFGRPQSARNKDSHGNEGTSDGHHDNDTRKYETNRNAKPSKKGDERKGFGLPKDKNTEVSKTDTSSSIDKTVVLKPKVTDKDVSRTDMSSSNDKTSVVKESDRKIFKKFDGERDRQSASGTRSNKDWKGFGRPRSSQNSKDGDTKESSDRSRHTYNDYRNDRSYSSRNQYQGRSDGRYLSQNNPDDKHSPRGHDTHDDHARHDRPNRIQADKQLVKDGIHRSEQGEADGRDSGKRDVNKSKRGRGRGRGYRRYQDDNYSNHSDDMSGKGSEKEKNNKTVQVENKIKGLNIHEGGTVSKSSTTGKYNDDISEKGNSNVHDDKVASLKKIESDIETGSGKANDNSANIKSDGRKGPPGFHISAPPGLSKPVSDTSSSVKAPPGFS